MTEKQLISKFIAQLCEKQFAFANSTLATIVEAKLKGKIKKEADKMSGKTEKKSKKDKASEFFAKMKGKKVTKGASKKNK